MITKRKASKPKISITETTLRSALHEVVGPKLNSITAAIYELQAGREQVHKRLAELERRSVDKTQEAMYEVLKENLAYPKHVARIRHCNNGRWQIHLYRFRTFGSLNYPTYLSIGNMWFDADEITEAQEAFEAITKYFADATKCPKQVISALPSW